MKVLKPIKIYSAFAKTDFLLTFAYRGQVLLWLLGGLIAAIMSGLLWYAVFSFGTSDTIAGFTFPQMLLYTIMSAICAEVMYCETAGDIARDVRQGMIGMRLTKPISYQGQHVAMSIGYFFGKLIVIGLPMIIIGTVVAVFGFGLTGIVWYNALIFFPAMFVGLLLRNAIGFAVGQIGFITQAMWGILSMLDVFLAFLSGAVVPISLLPDWAQTALLYTPFPSMTSLPVRIFLGVCGTREMLVGVATSLFWVVVLNILGALWYRRSIKHVVVFGG